jgi:glycosyltransferase involved in cell wall biosynthesis
MIIGVDARELRGRPTGAGRYLRNLLRHWASNEHDRVLAYTTPEATADPALPSERIAWRPIGRTRSRGLVWQERSLPPAVRADAVDVFFSPAYQCPLRLSVARVVAVHDLSFFSCPQDFALLDGLRRRILVAASIRLARVVLACSRFTRSEILARFPWASSRVVHVPLGADDDLPPAVPRDEARRRLGVSGPSILWVGSIFNRRCLPELLAAVAELRRRWPEITLDVVGDNRTHPRRDLSALAGASGIVDHVRLSGFVSDEALALRYAAADVTVLLSDYEGFGLPALETMARGVPLVAGDRPSVNEVVGDAALLVDPRDVRAVAEAIGRVLSDPGLARGLATHGRAQAARYSWRQTAERTRELLARAVSS